MLNTLIALHLIDKPAAGLKAGETLLEALCIIPKQQMDRALVDVEA